MSTRGRGRGGGAVPNGKGSSSSSAASSRSSSLTRPTISTTIQDTDQFMKQLTTAAGLTTGTRAAPKFKPNLNVKKKDEDKPNSNNTTPAAISSNDVPAMKKHDNIGNRNQGGRGRGINRGGNESYIQTEGIFNTTAQIPTAFGASSFGSRGGSSIKREGSASDARMPNIKKLGRAKTTLIGDVDGLKYEIDEENEPRLIPIAERKSVFDIKKEPNVKKKIKEPIPKSTEHIDSFVKLFSQHNLDSSTKPIVKDEPMEPIDIPKSPGPINDPTQLILMQFPDVLPCTRTSSASEKPELVSLSDLPDGFLGKLQIFKSGKCRLKLNDDTYLDVDVGQPTSFLQNVMVTEMASARPNDEHGINNDMNKLICLGDIKHKLTVSLDPEHVLHDTRQ